MTNVQLAGLNDNVKIFYPVFGKNLVDSHRFKTAIINCTGEVTVKLQCLTEIRGEHAFLTMDEALNCLRDWHVEQIKKHAEMILRTMGGAK